jgi:Ni/Co efflux regulator RcnB
MARSMVANMAKVGVAVAEEPKKVSIHAATVAAMRMGAVTTGVGGATRGRLRPPGRSRSWGRGQFLPQGYWSGQTADPRSHRLRPPPPGYGWYGVGRDAYLVQRSTGLILDTAPGAW